MTRSKTIALVLGPCLAVILLLAGYFWQKDTQELGEPLELHASQGAVSQQADAGARTPSRAKQAQIETKKLDDSHPQFDVVRVEPKGDALVAGHGEADANVAVLSNGTVVAEGKADSAGLFVFMPKLAPGGHNLTLRLTPPKAGAAPVASEQSVAVYVPKEKGEDVAVALAEPGKPTILLEDPTASAEAAANASADKPGTEKPGTKAPEVAAQADAGKTAAQASAEHLKADPVAKPEVSAKQQPAGQSPPAQPTKPQSQSLASAQPAPGNKSEVAKPAEPNPSVSIKTAEVVEPGGFFATGQASAGAHVRLYLNGSALAEVTAGKEGHWSVTVGKGLVPGQYAVRADQLDGKGQVSARAEVTFHYKNEPKVADATPSQAQPRSDTPPNVASAIEPKPTIVRPAPKADAAASSNGAVVGDASGKPPENATVAEIQTTTVEKGNNLWRISRATLGQGTRYTEIYAANSAQIRDPRLIYPGQIFVIPGQTPEKQVN